MKKPSIANVLTKLDTLHEAVTSFAGRFDTVESRFDTVESRFDTLESRFDKVERTLDEHSVALLELSTITAQHSEMHRDHSAALGRIEQRQRAETRTLDDHEGRIMVLEQRPYRSTPAV